MKGYVSASDGKDNSGGTIPNSVMRDLLQFLERLLGLEPLRGILNLAGQSDYFAFLHDDDRWEPEFLARRVKFLERYPDCGMVFSGHVDIDQRSSVVRRFAAPYPEGIVPPSELLPEMQRRNVVDVMHSVLVRRSALQAAGPYLDETIPRLFDWEL